MKAFAVFFAGLLLIFESAAFVSADFSTSTNFQITPGVVDRGGGPGATSTDFRLKSSIGQPATGVSSSSHFMVVGGFLNFPTSGPGAPSNLSSTAASASQINLSWTDNSSNESGFKIERKTDVNGAYAQVAVAGPNATSYSNTGLSGSTTYFYRVRAFNYGNNSA